jgi:hypothetical protein
LAVFGKGKTYQLATPAAARNSSWRTQDDSPTKRSEGLLLAATPKEIAKMRAGYPCRRVDQSRSTVDPKEDESLSKHRERDSR